MKGLNLDRLRKLSSSVVSPPAPPIAIDFGTAGLRLLQISSAEPPQLIAAAFSPTPEKLLGDPIARLDHQFASLPALVKAGGFSGRRAVCSLPASHTFCKHLQVPAEAGITPAESARGLVAAQLGCMSDSISFRAIETGATPGGKSELIALAVAQAVIKRAMDAMRAAKLDPVGIHPECLALLRCFDHITRRTDDHDTVTLYLDLGAGGTRVFIAHGQGLVFAKSIGIGGHFLDQTAARQLKCPLEEARRQRLAIAAITAPSRTDLSDVGAGVMAAGKTLARKPLAAAASEAKPGEAPQADGNVATATDHRAIMPPPHTETVEPPKSSPMRGQRLDLSEPLDTLTDEIGLCLRYHQSVFPGKRLSRVVFVGGEARHTALCQHIARVLKTAAHVADPLARVGRSGHEVTTGVDLREPQPGWAVAMGLCLSPTDL
jgi:Tfp pilus assembly PilM family ATPase